MFVPMASVAIAHLLSRATFGARPGDVERVRALGPAAWLERQLEARSIDDATIERTLAPMKTLAMSIPDLLREFPRPDPALRQKVERGEMTRAELMEMYPPEKRPGRIVAELSAAKMVRAVLSERQLEEVVIDFWFNVYARKGAGRWYVTTDFRTLFTEVATRHLGVTTPLFPGWRSATALGLMA